ncbi:ABC-ATPase domain-containing protein [Thermicanus aegyptius]|uniref:ABC-ATPase domain-containing protein n=1 Tax=Thermicanus aegyptius TaxID=94009 RepID=UPI0003F94F1D|nr:ABC-ATPase domain-containing protein [Thermicanus aegyptius]
MERLRSILTRIDGRGYKAYKEMEGRYEGKGYTLLIDHVQGDPFAAPSRIRLLLPRERARLSKEMDQTPWRKVALADFLNRSVLMAIRQVGKRRGSGRSGLIRIDTPGQEMLMRTAVRLTEEQVEFRLSVGLPARGRTVLGREAIEMFLEDLPEILQKGVLERDEAALRRQLELSDQQEAIYRYLEAHKLVAFVGDGAVLPRESGISDRPMQGKGVIPFYSPPSLAVEIPIPHREKPIRGMGIPQGVTLIVGGGYHGKSTLLKAIERGVYPHIPGDGREYVLTDTTAVKIRAEDGRKITGVNLTPFIHQLPYGKETTFFTTEDASGSTSQAANILEMLEVGARLLLIDEDTSATNFMIRDARMQALVEKEKEPITPFIDRVRELYEEQGVSTLLVVGGTGDYLDVADTVILMDEYKAYDVTQKAKEVAGRLKSTRKPETTSPLHLTPRIPLPESFSALRKGREKAEAKGIFTILLGEERIDLSYCEQLVDESQTRAIANLLRLLGEEREVGRWEMNRLLVEVEKRLQEKGLEVLSPYPPGKHPGDMALPRRFEIAMAVNRLRSLRIKNP